jgi:hypothetical protein
MVGSYFNESSFTLSVDSASAALSIGVTFRETPGSSCCFMLNVPGRILISVKRHAALLTDKDALCKCLIAIYPSARRASFA